MTILFLDRLTYHIPSHNQFSQNKQIWHYPIPLLMIPSRQPQYCVASFLPAGKLTFSTPLKKLPMPSACLKRAFPSPAGDGRIRMDRIRLGHKTMAWTCLGQTAAAHLLLKPSLPLLPVNGTFLASCFFFPCLFLLLSTLTQEGRTGQDMTDKPETLNPNPRPEPRPSLPPRPGPSPATHLTSLTHSLPHPSLHSFSIFSIRHPSRILEDYLGSRPHASPSLPQNLFSSPLSPTGVEDPGSGGQFLLLPTPSSPSLLHPLPATFFVYLYSPPVIHNIKHCVLLHAIHPFDLITHHT